MTNELNAEDFKLTKEILTKKDWINFQENIDIINQSFKNELIYNTNYQNLYHAFSNKMEKVFTKLTIPEVRKRDWINVPEDINLCRTYFVADFNHVINLGKKLRKCQDKNDSLFLKMDSFVKEYFDLAFVMKSLKQYIVKGRQPQKKQPVIIKEQKQIIKTTCPCCFRPVLVSKDGRIVNHTNHAFDAVFGFRSCRGIGFKPLEVSNEGLLSALKLYTFKMNRAKEFLDSIETREKLYKSYFHRKNIVINKEDYDFNNYKKELIEKTKSNINHFNNRIDFFTAKIKAWEPQI